MLGRYKNYLLDLSLSMEGKMDPHMTGANLPVRDESPKADGALFELLEIIKVLRRRLWWVVLPVILLTSLAAVYVSLATTKYTASMQLLVEGDSGPVINLNKEGTPVVEGNSLAFDHAIGGPGATSGRDAQSGARS
jgi:subunit length determinant Wzz-like protein